MFDAESAALIRSAPVLEGVDPALLPQELTAIYAELAGLRLRAAQIADDPAFATRLTRIARIATIYEALVDSGTEGEDRRAAAFVAGTAYQVLGRVDLSVRGRGEYLTASAINSNVAAPLLFLIAGQSPDAREAARALAGPRLDDIYQGILLETIEDLAQENFLRILERAERIGTLQPKADASLGDQSVQALYLLCWSGIVQMVAGLLGRDIPPISYDGFATAQAAFDQVAALSTQLLEFPADVEPLATGAQLYSAYAGPRHLARLLKHVADALEGVGIIHLPAPAGADEPGWRSWLRHRAASKPSLWPNHRAAVASGFLDAGRSAVLVLPTGAGKTTVSELKIAATLTAGRKVVFLVPTLALVDQLRDDLADSFPEGLADYEVSTDGDLTSLIAGPELKSIEVMTPERFLAVLSFVDADTSEIGLIVFDECHLLSPHGGGSRSTDAMLCLLHAMKRAPDADLLLLSAMLRNANEVANWLLDSILAGDLQHADVRYFMSRLRAGEEDDVAVDRAVDMMGRSFAAFRARRAGENAELEAKLTALKAALENEAAIAAGPVMKVAAFTGLAAEPLTAIVARIEADIDALPITATQWLDWLIDFFVAERANYELLLGKDTETVKGITRGRKTGGPVTDDELARLKDAMRAWMGGLPFDAIERTLGVAEERIGTCKRSRDLVLRLANRTLYMIATATSELAREMLVRLDKESANPAALEVLGVAIRKGMDSPDKVAFSYLSPALRTRIAIHREYANRFPARPPAMGQDYQAVLNSLDAAMAFGPLPDGAGLT